MTVLMPTYQSKPIDPNKLIQLRKLLADMHPDIGSPDALLAEDTQYGFADQFLFDKAKKDKSGIYSGISIFRPRFNSIQEIAEAIKINQVRFEPNKILAAFQPINDNYHFILIKKITKENYYKYLLFI